MKKQILLALPLATGLFAVSGAANAAAPICDASQEGFTNGRGCETIYIDKDATVDAVVLDKENVSIIGDGSSTLTGSIIVKSNVRDAT